MPSSQEQIRSDNSRDGAARKDASAVDRRRVEHATAEKVDLIDLTISVWQPLTERSLTHEDSREIIENMTGFFRILQEWERRERAEKIASPNKLGGPSREGQHGADTTTAENVSIPG